MLFLFSPKESLFRWPIDGVSFVADDGGIRNIWLVVHHSTVVHFHFKMKMDKKTPKAKHQREKPPERDNDVSNSSSTSVSGPTLPQRPYKLGIGPLEPVKRTDSFI